jgi:hypothetical protein
MKLFDDDLFDDNLLLEGVDDAEAPCELAEGDKDFLKSLEKMAAEIDSEADNSN